MDAAGDTQALLEEQLDTVDWSIGFLLLIVVSVLLSLWAVTLQRRQLACTLEGEPQAAGEIPPVFPIKISASALVVGALGFFLCLAVKGCKAAAQGEDCVAQSSASTNLLAAALVFAAALLRLDDLIYVEKCAVDPNGSAAHFNGRRR